MTSNSPRRLYRSVRASTTSSGSSFRPSLAYCSVVIWSSRIESAECHALNVRPAKRRIGAAICGTGLHRCTASSSPWTTLGRRRSWYLLQSRAMSIPRGFARLCCSSGERLAHVYGKISTHIVCAIGLDWWSSSHRGESSVPVVESKAAWRKVSLSARTARMGGSSPASFPSAAHVDTWPSPSLTDWLEMQRMSSTACFSQYESPIASHSCFWMMCARRWPRVRWIWPSKCVKKFLRIAGSRHRSPIMHARCTFWMRSGSGGEGLEMRS
mmetsp:Transcript_41547/g.98483  ORF Transcript_41547/g.98483 Transcript_41547/m.98483 type:complete len:269 (-) Transcript_41547:1023-1829(-)